MSTIRCISSMATKNILAELAEIYEKESGSPVEIVSVGGVDAVKRVQAGEKFDIAILASDAIDTLVSSGRVFQGSKTDFARSEVAAAVRAGAARVDISTEEALLNAVLLARGLGYSTGPSGAALIKLFERWGIANLIAERLVQAKPGVPVGSLLAEGAVDLGFQQMSELIHTEGIDILGRLPPAARIVTTFSCGACAAGENAGESRDFLEFLGSPRADAAKLKEGMAPAAQRGRALAENSSGMEGK